MSMVFFTTFWRLFVICYWTDARQHGIASFYTMNKTKNPQTSLVLIDCSRVFASLGVLQITNAIFRLCYILFGTSFSEKIFNAFTCSKQNNRKNYAVQFTAMDLAVCKHKLMINKLLYEQAFQTLLIRKVNGNWQWSIIWLPQVTVFLEHRKDLGLIPLPQNKSAF